MQGLDRSLFERLQEEGIGDLYMLKTQFRMNQKIMQWPSEVMYDGKLIAHCTVQEHRLQDLKVAPHCHSLPLAQTCCDAIVT